jgi:hypothetical protein
MLFASPSWSGDLDMARIKQKWPQYESPAPNYLAAMALVLLQHNEFEFRIFELFLMQITKLGIPYRPARRMYLEMTERKRVDFFKMVLHLAETEKSTRDYTFKLLKYFDRCAQIRNLFAHARYSPSFLGDDHKRFYLSKRPTQTSRHLIYPKPTLGKIRTLADQIHEGANLASDLGTYVFYQGTPTNELPLTVRSGGPLSLLEIPPLPNMPKKYRSPHTPKLPQYLLRSRHRSKPA